MCFSKHFTSYLQAFLKGDILLRVKAREVIRGIRWISRRFYIVFIYTNWKTCWYDFEAELHEMLEWNMRLPSITNSKVSNILKKAKKILSNKVIENFEELHWEKKVQKPYLKWSSDFAHFGINQRKDRALSHEYHVI